MRKYAQRSAPFVFAAAFATLAATGAPVASAGPNSTDCQQGQIVIDGQCAAPPAPTNAPAPGMGSGGGDKRGY
jgi:hypothetical protein